MAEQNKFQQLLQNFTDPGESSPYSNDLTRLITNELIDLAMLHIDYTKSFIINIHFRSSLYHKIGDKQLYITRLSQLVNKQLAPKGSRLEVENINILEDKRAKSPYRMSLDDQSILERTQSVSTSNDEENNAYAFLMLTNGTAFDLRLPIVNIGRSVENTIVIEDSYVSRNHSQIRLIKGNCWIFDKNSSGGTRVNGELISQKILHPGDVIRMGGTDLIFGVHDDEISDTSKI